MPTFINHFGNSQNKIIGLLQNKNEFIYSFNGFNWSISNFNQNVGGSYWRGITYGNNKWIVIGDSPNEALISNDDGGTWANINFPTIYNQNIDSYFNTIKFCNNQFFITTYPINQNGNFVSDTGTKILSSLDGINWQVSNSLTTGSIHNIVYGNNIYLASLRQSTSWILYQPPHNRYLYSYDGNTWNMGTLPISFLNLTGVNDNTTYDFVFGGNQFIAIPRSDRFNFKAISNNGLNWTNSPSGLPSVRRDHLAYGDNRFLALPGDLVESGLLSVNGDTWTAIPTDSYGHDDLIYFQNKFITAVGSYMTKNIFIYSKLPFNFPYKESGNLYSPTSSWVNGVGNANIGNWFFVDRAGTFRGIINTNQNGRTSIGNSGFFFAPSTGSAVFYVDAYFNLTNPLINGQGISLNANYSWNGGMRGIEFKPGTDGASTFRIEHGNGDDRIYLRGPSFSDQIISTNGFQQALNYNIVYRQTGILFEARNYSNNNLIFSTGLSISQTIRQIHFYIGNIQATQATQLNYGLGVNNLETHYKQKVPFYSSSSSSFFSSSSSSSPFTSSSSSFSSSSSSFSSSSSSNSSSSSSFSSSSSNFIPTNNWALASTITGSLYQYLGSDLAINNSGNILFIGSNDPNKSVSIYTGLNNNWNLNKIITGFGWSGWNLGLVPSLIAINDNGNILAVTDPNKGFVNIYTGINSWNFKQSLTGMNGTIVNIHSNYDGSIISLLGRIIDDGKVFIYTGNSNDGWNLNQVIRPDAAPPSPPSIPNTINSFISNSSGDIMALWYTNGLYGLAGNRVLLYTKNLDTWNYSTQIIVPQNTNNQRSRNININNDGTLIAISECSESNLSGIQYIYTGKNNLWSLKQTIIHNGPPFGNEVKFTDDKKLLISNVTTENIYGLNIYSGYPNIGWNLIQRFRTGASTFDINKNATIIVGSNPNYGDLFRESGIAFIFTGKNLFL